jgi:hypothetical protein
MNNIVAIQWFRAVLNASVPYRRAVDFDSCPGCKEGCGSQRDHLCLTLSPAELHRRRLRSMMRVTPRAEIFALFTAYITDTGPATSPTAVAEFFRRDPLQAYESDAGYREYAAQYLELLHGTAPAGAQAGGDASVPEGGADELPTDLQ